MKPEGNVDYGTTSKLAYDRKPLARAQTKKPAERKTATGRFDGLPTYKEDFRQWPLGEKVEPKKRVDYRPPEGAFEGQPTYSSDFVR